MTKTTGGLLVLPKSHPLIQRRMQDERGAFRGPVPSANSAGLPISAPASDRPRTLRHLLVRAVNFHQARYAPAAA